jgi:zinc finger-like protein
VVGSAAEDKVVFPAVDRKVKQQVSYITDHADEERKFIEVRRLLEGVQAALEQNTTAAELYGELCLQAEVIVETIQQHLLDEEDQVR